MHPASTGLSQPSTSSLSTIMQSSSAVFAMDLLFEAGNFLGVANLRDDGLDGDTDLAISRQDSLECHDIYQPHLME